MDGKTGYTTDVVNNIIREHLTRRGRGAATALALELGVTAETVSKWTRNATTPDRDRWPAIEEALGLPHNTFMMATMGEDADELGIPFRDRRRPNASTGDALQAMRNRLDSIEQQLHDLNGAVERIARSVGVPSE